MEHRKPLVEAAYEVLSDYAKKSKNKAEIKPYPFAKLLKETGVKCGIEDDEKLLDIASEFYTALTIDGRFVIKENNTWVLREYQKFDDVHIDVNSLYSESKDEEEFENKKEESEESSDYDEENDSVDYDNDPETSGFYDNQEDEE